MGQGMHRPHRPAVQGQAGRTGSWTADWVLTRVDSGARENSGISVVPAGGTETFTGLH